MSRFNASIGYGFTENYLILCSIVNNALCSDNQYCNGSEVCNLDFGCINGTPPDCNDSINCTSDYCDEDLDICVNTAMPYYCDDNLFCNGFETCNTSTGCIAGTDPCDDSNDCTTDTCNEDNDSCSSVCDDITSPLDDCCEDETCGIDPQCSYCDNDIDCNDTIWCNGTETCNLSTHLCESGTAPDCSDGNSCTNDLCYEAIQECINTCNAATPSDICCSDDSCL